MKPSRNQCTNITKKPNFIIKLGKTIFPKHNKKLEK